MNPTLVHQHLAAGLTAAALLTSATIAPAALAHPADPSVSTADYGKLALAFGPNRGQTDPEVDFLARGRGYSLFLTPAEAVLVLAQPGAAVDGNFNAHVAGVTNSKNFP